MTGSPTPSLDVRRSPGTTHGVSSTAIHLGQGDSVVRYQRIDVDPGTFGAERLRCEVATSRVASVPRFFPVETTNGAPYCDLRFSGDDEFTVSLVRIDGLIAPLIYTSTQVVGPVMVRLR